MRENFIPALEVFQRLQEGPLRSHVRNFAFDLLEQGYAKYTIRLKLQFIADFYDWLNERDLGIKDVNERVINKFTEFQGREKSLRNGNFAALRVFLNTLRDAGITLPSRHVIEVQEIDRIEHGFAKYLLEERGLSHRTVTIYIAMVRRFLTDRFKTDTIQWEYLKSKDLTTFILRYVHTVKRSTAKLMTTSLRAFFRYLCLRGKIAPEIAGFIPTIATWRLSDIPKYLEPEQVECLLKNCDQNKSIEQRDYVVLLLLARLGLRAGEVATLILDDIDWETGVFTIQGKGPRQDRLPIPHDVGEALAMYLRYGRPRCSTRRVFVRSRAPHTGFSSSVAICNIVRRALFRAKLKPAHKGAHLLRHSLATHMLRKGATLSEIGEILRHQQTTTTEIYTKVDIASLRSLSQAWPGGEI